MIRTAWALVLAAAAATVLAQAPEPRAEPPASSGSANYSLDWVVLDANGGGTAQSPGYRVQLTVGQTAIGVSEGPAGRAELGFWYGATGDIFSDGFESGDMSAWSATVPLR